MCLPPKPEQDSASTTSSTRSIFGLGAVMVVACVGAPVIVSGLGALGLGMPVGAGGAAAALVLCAAVPAVVLAMRRRA